MGLFDIFKRKKKAPDGDGPSLHYVFAHYALRHLALAEPMQFLAIAASDEPERFVEVVLQDVAERCEQPCTIDARSVKFHPVSCKGFPCAVVELPAPQETAEAFMVALVVLMDMAASDAATASSSEGRYFTLEKGFTLSDEPRTVLAEWDESSHSNFGDGPQPTVEGFVAAIKEHL